MVLRLETLELNNFKTFQRSTFNFTAGHNVILGENGAGKSSIFEAITFCLFGSVPGKKISSLIRHDTQKMEISLEFSVDNKDFKIERSATKSVSTALLMEKNGKRIAEKAKAVNEEIEQILGLGQRVFSNVVYIPQGQIAAIASERPSERRELFDKILGYYLYKKTSDRLRVIERSAEQSINAIQERIRDFQDDIKRKEEIETELENLELKLISLQKDKIDLQPKLEKAIENYEEINKEREEINQIEERLKSKEEEIEKRKSESKETKSNLEEILDKKLPVETKELDELKNENKAKLKHLEKSLSNLANKVENGKNIDSILTELKKREESIITQISGVKTKIEKMPLKIKDESQNYQTLLIGLNSKKKDCLSTKSEIKTNIEDVRLKEKEQSVLLEKKSNIEEELKTNEEKREKNEKEIAAILPDWKKTLQKTVKENIPEIKKKQELMLIELQKEKIKLQAKITSLNDQSENESSLFDLLSNEHIEECPLCEQGIEESHKANIKAKKKIRIKEIKLELKNLVKKRPIIDKKLEKSQIALKEISNREKKQVSLQLYTKEHFQLEKANKKSKKKLKSIEKDLQKLEDIPILLMELKNQLIEIEGEENEINEQIKQIDSLILLNDQLTEYKSELDSVMKGAKENETNFDYLELEENVKVLEQQRRDQKQILNIIPRIEGLIKTLNSIEQLLDEKNSIILDLTEKKTDFDNARFEKYKKLVDKLKAKKVEIETKIKNLEKEQIPDKKRSLNEIKKKEKKLLTIKTDLKTTEVKLDTIGIIRGFTKEIVPILRRQHVLAISEYSTEIFSYLMNNEEYEGIEITEDYELLILQSGKKHDLTILSGGEQVIACLAIRLAIAKLLANQDIMLLDEPTVMLDAFRRKELVEVFDKTKPVSQTIIVTHDTEFERVADTTFTIIKRAGKAKVIAEEIDNIVSQQKKYQVLTRKRFKQLEIS